MLVVPSSSSPLGIGYAQVARGRQLQTSATVEAHERPRSGEKVKRWRKTEVRVERQEITVRMGRGTICCRVCGAGSVGIRAANAAAILGPGANVLEPWLAKGKMQESRNADRNWLACTIPMRGTT